MRPGIVAAPEVVRGIRLDATPLRLARAGLAGAVAPGTCEPPTASARDEGLRTGLEQGLREGRAQGLQEGREEGLRKGRAEAAEQLRLAVQQAIAEAVAPLAEEQRRLQKLASALGQAVDDALAPAHDEMVALCFETICRILGEEAIRPEVVPQHLAHLRRLHRGRDVVLHVHPQDAELLAKTLDAAGEVLSLQCVADPDIALGGCIVEGAGGGLDARLETMLLACKDALLAGRRGEAGSRHASEARP